MNYGGEQQYFDENYPQFQCKKHPNSTYSSGGFCSYCLTDKLYELVCPQCGTQRLSSCSCSCTVDFSSNRNISSFPDVGHPGRNSFDVGHVGRNSFSVENDKSANTKAKHKSSSSNVDNFATLRRNNSICLERKETKEKFWNIGKLFRKKRDKTNNNQNYNEEEINYEGINNNNNNINNRISRSRSVSKFRGLNDTEGNFPVSAARARASTASIGNNFYLDPAKMSCFSESEARFSNFDYIDTQGFNKNNYNYNNTNTNNNNYNYNNSNSDNNFSSREAEFMSGDDPNYIDLKLPEMSSSSSINQFHKVPNLASMKKNRLSASTKEFGNRGNNNEQVFKHEMLRNSSCRRSSVTESELRKCKKSSKFMKWFSKDQTSSRGNYEDHHDFNS